MAITPWARAASVRLHSLVKAPRSLNEFVTWRFSYLTWISAPLRAESRGAGRTGVRNTAPAIVRRARSMSLNETVTGLLPDVKARCKFADGAAPDRPARRWSVALAGWGARDGKVFNRRGWTSAARRRHQHRTGLSPAQVSGHDLPAPTRPSPTQRAAADQDLGP